MPLLRASDFCRIRRRPSAPTSTDAPARGADETARTRSLNGTTATIDDSNTLQDDAPATTTTTASAITVRLRLMFQSDSDSAPSFDDDDDDNNDGVVVPQRRSKVDPTGNKKNNNTIVLAPVVVYASSTKVLKDVALIAGSRAWLSLAATAAEISGGVLDCKRTTTGAARCVAVRVQLLPSPGQTCDDSTIYISPLTALNLGWDFDYHHDGERDTTTVLAKIAPIITNSSDNSFLADHVTLRTLGVNNSSGTPFNLLNDKRAGDPNDQQTWPLPTAGSVLQVDTLISLKACYYHVISVNGNSNPRYCALYTTTSRTSFRLENNAGISSLPRLPPPLRPLQSRRASSWPVSSHHPDIPALLRSWEYPAAANLPAQLVQHVIGTESDHHTVTAVQQAAELAGRTCVVVPGLAAAAHLWDSGGANNRNGDRRHTVSTGSLVDKLAGLQVALERALHHRAAPSILLLPNLHEELSRDATQRHEEEGRIWSLLIEQLSSLRCDESSTHSSCLPHVPRVIVVLATDAPLPPGPLLQNLVLASVHMSLPNNAYIRYLWQYEGNANKTEAVVADNEEEIQVCDAEMQECLQGRPVREILQLRHEWKWEKRNGNVGSINRDSLSEELLLKDLCEQFDEQRRHKSCLGRIPSVHWEDVGGLANVRREIMNAIELPLKHPHLFGSPSSSSSSGRRTTSGILLYGAPGTGKTLVAKAAATECGLPFISVKGPELLGSYVGESEAQVRAVFAQARIFASQNQPAACVLFFDELDSLAPRRGDQASGGNVMDRVVATLFTELDKKIAKDQSILFCMGATNRPDLLDPALLRPGRLDRLVYLGISQADQANILATQMRHLRLDGDAMEMAIEIVPHLPPNLTGADLSTIATGGLLRATERLCAEADRRVLELQQEQYRRQSNSSLSKPNVSVDQVLMSWDADHLEPVVTLDDLLFAARKVVPSVSAAELENYERLGEKYRLA